MARAIKQGQHIFIAFQDGEAVLDSQLRPRMYKSREQFEKSFPAWRDGKAELVEYAPTLSQPSNEPLTLEELREMDEPVWGACKPIEGGNGYWCLCQHGHIITPAGSIYDVKEIPHWVFYRRPLEGAEDGNV